MSDAVQVETLDGGEISQLCDRPTVARDDNGLAALNPVQDTTSVASQVADGNVHAATFSLLPTPLLLTELDAEARGPAD